MRRVYHLSLRALTLLWAFLSPPEMALGDSQSLAPGYGELGFDAPRAGAYHLEVIGAAADTHLQDSQGKKVSLHGLMQGKITLVSFIYSSCHETNGCPLATHVLEKTRQALEAYPETASRVRMLTISFDPGRDTPDVMARYGKPFLEKGYDWHFLTPEPGDNLDRLLRAYQQTLTPEVDPKGSTTGDIAHMLRVYLVDPALNIRNSYTPSILHRDLLLADIRTLDMERLQSPSREDSSHEASSSKLHAGDDKKGYERSSYQTASAALSQRKGVARDLIADLSDRDLGLPEDPSAHRSPLTPQKVALGRKIFYDRRLSLNGTFSCAMCHVPEQGFTSQEQLTAIGIEGRTVRRNAPTLLNAGRLHHFFHDGREDRLENQVWGPFLASNEMGNPSVGEVLRKIREATDYRGLFESAFGREPSMDNVGEALAQYERTLIAGASPFDTWRSNRQPSGFSPQAKKGFAVFTGKAGCSQCHTLEAETTLLSDEGFHNTGIGYQGAMAPLPEQTRVQIAPGVWATMNATALASVSEKKPRDLGRYEITQDPKDRWKYRTPSLRNIALTPPYMHDGSLRTLREVIAFYQKGGIANPGLDPLIHPLSLTSEDVEALIIFLEALTGNGVEQLVEDAWAAPVGDPGL